MEKLRLGKFPDNKGGSCLQDIVIKINTLIDSTQQDITSAVDEAVANLVGSAPETLDTIYELAAALENNADILSTFLTKEDAGKIYLTIENSEVFLTKESATSTYATKEENALKADKSEVESKYALKTEIPDVTSYIKTTDADAKYVAQVSGKGLSTNDFTTELKTKLDNLPTNENLNQILDTKVDEVEDKGLSTNDFTNELKVKLDALPTATEIESDLNSKVDVEEGKELSSNDFTDDYKAILDNLETLGLTNWYGVEKVKTSSSTQWTRIGNTSLHSTLPIQNKMRACILNDNGTVNYYLNPENWDQKADGTAALRDGTDGQVMIEIPEHYRICVTTDDDIYRVLLSESPLPGFKKIEKFYIGAYEASIARTDSKLSSVKNSTAEYRGGNNQTDWDSLTKSQLGKCATYTTRANFRTYAANRGFGWYAMSYNDNVDLFWLYVVEYANTNSQLPVNGADGSKGLGNGATNINSEDWNTFNGYYPLLNIGDSDSLNSGSGEVMITLPEDFKADTTIQLACNRYRGIENPFGHIWKNLEGCIFDIKTDDDGGTSECYICRDPQYYADAVGEGWEKLCDVSRANGYISDIVFGEYGDIIPIAATGASSTTYYGDYWYTLTTTSSLRTLLAFGSCCFGADAGLLDSHSYSAVSYVNPHVGARLCYHTSA